MQSVPNTCKVLSSNSANGEVYSVQHYVIKFVCYLRQVGGFSLCTPVPSRSVVFLCVHRFPPGRWVFSVYTGSLHQWNWPPRYNWNIVERGVKHHNPNPLLVDYYSPIVSLLVMYFLTQRESSISAIFRTRTMSTTICKTQIEKTEGWGNRFWLPSERYGDLVIDEKCSLQWWGRFVFYIEGPIATCP